MQADLTTSEDTAEGTHMMNGQSHTVWRAGATGKAEVSPVRGRRHWYVSDWSNEALDSFPFYKIHEDD